MKLFTLIIITNLLLFISNEPITHNIQTIQCENNCLDSFESNIEFGQSLILKSVKFNKFVFPSSANPGLGTFFRDGDKTISIDYFKKNLDLHSEVNYIKAKLIELVTNEYSRKRKKKKENEEKVLTKIENEKPSNYYSEVKGNLAVFTFWSPCQSCYSMYLSLAQKFPNVHFEIYFSDFFKFFVEPFLQKTIKELRNHSIAKQCENQLDAISTWKQKNAKKDINKFLLNNLTEVPEKYVHPILNCLYTVTPNGPVPKNLRIRKLSLDPFIENVYFSIARINEDSLEKIKYEF